MQPFPRFAPLCLALPLVLALPAAAQVTGAAHEALLRPTAPVAGDAFGADVATAADFVVVGAPGRAVGGAAFVFELAGGAWTQAAELTGATTVSGDDFGTAVATDGTWIAVGAPGVERNGAPAGAVHVFGRAGAQWVEVAQLFAEGGVSWGAFFGRDVALDAGRLAAVGTLTNGVDGLFVFAESGGAWSHVENLSPTAELPGGWSSIRSVALAGEWLASGAPFDFDPQFQSSGTASVHRLQPGGATSALHAWADTGDLFGWSVALDDEVLAVGATFDQHPGAGATGSVSVFVRQGTSWGTPAVLHAAGGADGDELGFAVAVDGALLVASAVGADVGASDAGRVHVFEFELEGGGWVERAAFGAPAPVADGEFGEVLALQGDRVLAGAPGELGPGGEAGAGAVHVVRLLEEPGYALCLGDGSGAACPCGNASPVAGTGCAHSGGAGMTIRGTGSRSVATDDLALVMEGCPLGNSGIVYVGRTSLAPGVALFDGLQCAGGDVRRFQGLFQASGTATDTGFAAQDPSGTYFAAGLSYVYQYWTRDVAGGPSPCGTSATFSPGYAVTLEP